MNVLSLLKAVMARGAILSMTKLIGAIPSFSPFDKGD
jgi:hypothetical protein